MADSPRRATGARAKPKLADLSVDDLIEQFDSIPEIMASLKANTASPGRYSCT